MFFAGKRGEAMQARSKAKVGSTPFKFSCAPGCETGDRPRSSIGRMSYVMLTAATGARGTGRLL